MKRTETQTWPTNDSGGKCNKPASSLIISLGYDKSAGITSEGGQPGFCDRKDAKPGIPDTGGVSVEVREQLKARAAEGNQGGQGGGQTERGCKWDQLRVKRSQSALLAGW